MPKYKLPEHKLTRRKMVKAMKSKGYSRRTGEKVLTAIINIWKDAFGRRREPTQVPTGWLVIREMRPIRTIRLGRIVDIPKRNETKRVRLVSKPKTKDWQYAKPKVRPVPRQDKTG